MNLKMTTKTTHFIDYGDLERFLTEISGNDVEIIETSNDVSYDFSVVKSDINEYFFKWGRQEIEDCLKSGYIEVYRLHGLFVWLLYKEYIKEGNYLVKVGW